MRLNSYECNMHDIVRLEETHFQLSSVVMFFYVGLLSNFFTRRSSSVSTKALPAPKIVFNRPNGKKYHQPSLSLPMDPRKEWESPAAHEDNVKFVYEDFVPIDLDEWWAQRFLANIDKLS
ncbi:uncharacterized protein LOC133170296 isoform X3 [Syngnathus typhle]|uniref:uncharacterized protein LOC133170296 isoform X3 n=1 Tax=Syngnathus typhle TaxID=161592 RepID=UPI002A6B703B|nr:uncharacterized protein LOC133170296 isoform X3 [Syngnathus typhle]